MVAGFGRIPKTVMVYDKLPQSIRERGELVREHGLEGESSSWASIWAGEAVMTASEQSTGSDRSLAVLSWTVGVRKRQQPGGLGGWW